MKAQRLLELDALRGIAAFMVVLYHYFYRYDVVFGHQDVATEWSYVGRYGVQLFFIISGFVIYWTLERCERPFDFIVSRFSRLYPVYWFCIFLTSTFVILGELPERAPSLSTIVINLTMIQEYLRIPHVDGVYWTLTVELTFYFWIFCLFVFKQLKNTLWWMLPVIGVNITRSLGLIDIPGALNMIFFIDFIPLFAAGICFFYIANGRATMTTYVYLTLTLISAYLQYEMAVFLLIMSFYLAIYVSTNYTIKILTFKPLVVLGAMSYSFYLIHQYIGFVIINKMMELGVNTLISIASAIVCSLALAYCAMVFVEQPSLKYIRTKYTQSSFLQKFASAFKLSK